MQLWLFLADLQLYHSESLELMLQRWSKLERDFRTKKGRYDISKIPDIYDCVKYDTQHNATLALEDTLELLRLSRALADVVIPQVGILCGRGQAGVSCSPGVNSGVCCALAGVRHQLGREAGHRSGLLRSSDEEDPAGPAEDARGPGRQQAPPTVSTGGLYPRFHRIRSLFVRPD